MRKFLLALPLLALTGACAGPLSVNGSDNLSTALCDRTLEERFARHVLANSRFSVIQVQPLDCTGPDGVPDGLPDDLGRWVPPGE